MSFSEFEIEDSVINNKTEKIIKIDNSSKLFNYEEFYKYCRRESSFYRAAKKMEFFTDDSSLGEYAPFMQYFSKYHHMDKVQLQSYFVWRTKVRNGIVEQIDTSYIFVYIYELLHLVGVAGAEEGFLKLTVLWENAVGFEPKLTSYLTRWLVDFVKYYNLPLSYLEHPMLKKFGVGVEGDAEKLMKALSVKDYSAVNDVVARNGYNYKKGAFSKKTDEAMVERVTTKLFQNIMETKDFISKNIITEHSSYNYAFNGAVFEQNNYSSSREQKLTQYLNKQYLEELGRTIEIALDEIFSVPQKLHDRELQFLRKTDVTVIKKELKKDVFENKIVLLQKQKTSKKTNNAELNNCIKGKEIAQIPREVEINVNKLLEIRERADLIAERLIPGDLLKEYKGESVNEVLIIDKASAEEIKDGIDGLKTFINNLDDHGKKILVLIANKSSYDEVSKYAVGNYLMLEEEIEKINELALDFIGDTIIDGSENSFSIYDEYSAGLANYESLN